MSARQFHGTVYGLKDAPKEELLYKSFDEAAQEQMSLTSAQVLQQVQDDMNRDIVKAMGANSIQGGGGLGDLGPLRLEDLDATMTKVLYNRSHFVFQRWIQRETADQLIYQYNVQHSYGSARGEAGFMEGRGPKGGVSRFSRETTQIRFFGVKGGITHQASLMKRGMVQDPVAKENEDRVTELLTQVERMIIWGNSALVAPTGDTVAYDGLYLQIRQNAPEENIIDMRGEPFDLSILDDIGLIYHDFRYDNDFGPIKMFAPGQVFTDLSKTLQEGDRRMLGGLNSQPQGGYVPGTPIRGYETQFGYIPFQPSVFMQRTAGNKPMTEPKEAKGTATVVASAVAAADVTSTSQMESDTHYYFVGVVYPDGESIVSAGVSASPTAGQKVTVTITRTADTSNVRGYRLYRGPSSNAAKAGWIADVPDNASSITFVDYNDVLPNTNIALVLHNGTDNLMLAQLAPLMRYPLPVEETTQPFFYLLYHTLLVKAPSRMFLIRNIGKAS